MIVKQEFKAGDIVHFIPMGKKEYVLKSNDDGVSILYPDGMSLLYPLEIKSESCQESFTMDGKLRKDHTHPLLILIRRPEEKKKWYQVFYKCHNEMPEIARCLYNSEEDFYHRGITKNVIEWIELKFVCER